MLKCLLLLIFCSVSFIKPRTTRTVQGTAQNQNRYNPSRTSHFQLLLQERRKETKRILKEREKGIRQILKARWNGIREIIKDRKDLSEEIENEEIEESRDFSMRLNTIEKILKDIQISVHESRPSQ